MIEVTNLRHNYGVVEALKGISFRVKPGEICGYLGPNGAGKSTTVKSLVGILRPQSGTVRVAGHDLAEAPLEAKRRLGYVPENAAAFSLLTPREYLQCVGELHEVDSATLDARVGKLLASFGLAECAGRRVDTLSKGQRQKVVLSAALLHDPEVLIWDEPLTGLDANAARTVKELLGELAARGRTVLFCTHTLEVVERLCHRVVVLHGGSIVADAPTGELLALSKDKSLEGLFRELTTDPAADEDLARLLDALRPPAPAVGARPAKAPG